MGLLLDIVPNHMAASVENPWWENVLRKGSQSPFASFFDVDWRRKLLLPVLAAPYGEVLESGQLKVTAENGHSTLHYNELVLPITVPAGADLSNVEGLDKVLSQQPYRLAHWRKATDSVNYRRFFDINDLV